MTKEPCRCGAPDCKSCGPAQGSFKCAVCGHYACEDHDEDEDPEEEEEEKGS